MRPRLRVVVNADDFGYDEDTLGATVACFDEGVVSSASIMPTMPATRAACEYARRHPEFSYGVHLTFVRDTCEAAAAPAHEVATLLDADGRLRPSHEVRLRALAGLLREEDIARECDAQLGRVRDSGVAVSHVDSHGHLHKFPVFRRALARVLPRHGVTRLRNQQNVHFRRPWTSPTYWLGAWWGGVEAGPWRTTDWFYMPATARDAGWPERVADGAWAGTLEVGVHPGRTESWRQREWTEAARLAMLLRERGVALVTWRDV